MIRTKKWVLGTLVAVVLVIGCGVAVTQIYAGDKPSATADEKPSDAKKSDAQKPAWITRCDDLKDADGKVTGKYCEAVQSLSVAAKDADPSTAQRLLEIAVGYPPALKGKASGVVILPLGIAVNNDISLRVDDTKLQDIETRYCDPRGCYAIFEMDDGDMATLRKGKEIGVKATLFNGQPLDILMSLDGIAAALDASKPKAE